MKTRKILRPVFTAALAVAVLSPLCISCGGGIPVRVHIDEFTFDLDVDELVGGLVDQFKAQGMIPPQTPALPEIWPSDLPRIQYKALLATPPVPVDLTPDPSDPDYEKYKMINDASQAIRRIEMNRLILRVEESTLTMDLPELRLQVASSATADPGDRLAWQTVAAMGPKPGSVGDNEFQFIPSGELYLNSQLMDEAKEFAIRVVGKIDVDTDENPRLPAGAAALRMIIVATFFIDPEGAIGAAGNLSAGGF